MWATIAAAGISAASSILGGALKRKAAEKSAAVEDALLQKQIAENKAFFDRYYNADATQFADNRYMLTEAANRFNRANRASSATNAVIGGSNSSVAAAKEANSQAYGQIVGNVAANAQKYKNDLLNNYRERAMNLQNARAKIVAQRSADKQASIGNAVDGIVKTASSFIASNTRSNSPSSKSESDAGSNDSEGTEEPITT